MQTIFVQLKCDLSKAYAVAAELVERDRVSEIYSISGQFDLVAKCYLDDDAEGIIKNRLNGLLRA